jgi:hypothetical protein
VTSPKVSRPKATSWVEGSPWVASWVEGDDDEVGVAGSGAEAGEFMRSA